MSEAARPYSLWQTIHLALNLATRAVEEVRALAATGAKPGPPGPAGKLPVVRLWADGVHYEGDVVVWGGDTYQACRDTGREPPGDDWALLAAGADGRSFTVRGTWREGERYDALDVVALSGSSFVARADGPGACPGDGWQLIAAAGNRGKPGEVGPRGERGPPGAAAEPVALEVDPEGLLTLRLGDGATLTCDLYPVLAKLR